MAANSNQLMGMLGVTQASNGRFVTSGGSGLPPAPRALGDDAAVMMISGLKDAPSGAPASPPPVDLMTALKTPIRIGSLELPLWVWLAAALALGGAGGYWFAKRK